jgi:non-haem Fe2+, alpha-ketoglutarate-dependent halogenase
LSVNHCSFPKLAKTEALQKADQFCEMTREYNESRFVSLINVLTIEEVDACISDIEAFEAEMGKQIDFLYKSRSPQIFCWSDRFVHHPKILDAVEDIIGPDIMCYHATLWVKPAKSNSFVRWHQDGAYFFLHPAVHITAWVALTLANVEAGCMQVIPASDKNPLFEHNDDTNPDNMILRGQGLAAEIDMSEAVSMPLQAGQMSLHHTKLIHAYFNNNRKERRIGCSISYIPVSVKDIGKTPAHALLVRGEDKYKHFLEEERLCNPQTKEQMAYHLTLMKQFRKRQAAGALHSNATIA